MEDWGLQAVVGGTTNYENNTIPCFDSWTQIQNEQYPDHDFLFDLPDLLLDSTEAIVGEDLEQLYRPFYPVMNSQIILTSSNIAVPKEGGEKIDDQKQSTSGNVQPTKHKKRKNQEKKEVVQVGEEGLYSDMWAWRKYGQKPIKGSPFPRSYYRCSSEKGCPARKQVEQSFSDPGTFTVTYKAEHSHTQPTRRNSLAGKIRQRFSSTPKVVINSGDPSTAKTQDSDTPVLISILSPATPSISSMEEKRRFQDCDAEIDEFIIPEMILGDDFFVGFEDLNGMAFDIAVDGSNSGHFR